VLIISKILNFIRNKKKQNKDKVIEWYGPDIYLKEKEKDFMFIDDIEEQSDRDYYKKQEEKRIRNVKRNNRSNTESTKNIRS